MSFARINDVLLHYRLAGPVDAPALVFVNSLGTDARIWDDVIERFSDRYRVLSYDKRGHGLSDTPDGDYSLSDHIEDLTGLLDHLGFNTFFLAGVSVGGLIVQGMALHHPEKLRGIVLCNTAPRMGDAAMWASRMESVRNHGMASIADAVMDRWFSVDFRAGYPDALAGWRNLFLRSDAKGYASTCATLRDTDLTDAIADIALPTLIVAGEADLAAPVELVRNCMRIAGARFEILPATGHIPSIEQPERLSALMSSFFKEAVHG